MLLVQTVPLPVVAVYVRLVVALVCIIGTFAALWFMDPPGAIQFQKQAQNHRRSLSDIRLQSQYEITLLQRRHDFYPHFKIIRELLRHVSGKPKIKATTVALVGDNESLRKDIISAISNITRRTPIAINGQEWKNESTWAVWLSSKVATILQDNPTALITLNNLPQRIGALHPLHHCFNDNNPFLNEKQRLSCSHAIFVLSVELGRSLNTTHLSRIKSLCKENLLKCQTELVDSSLSSIMSESHASHQEGIVDSRATERRIRWILPTFFP